MFFYILIITITTTIIYSEKHCVNCKYFVRNPFLDTFGKCSAFRKNTDYNKIDYLVSGKEKIEYKFCVTARENEDLCGEEGKMYMERNNCIKDFIIPFINSIKTNNINI